MDNRYPLGHFTCPSEVQEKDIQMWINEMTTLPSRLKALTASLDELDLTKKYRDNSWNVRQLIHHFFDSHLNGYMRVKLALTEDNPVVKTYEESEWGKLIDYELPISVSVQLIESLHERWTYLLKNLTTTQLQRSYQYPDGSKMRIDQSIALYAWHGNHHLAHIQQALNN
ncbi:YfiT family bacillithiol transferase [Metabacillus rhizolycopersici]|uniref:Putative metal-dependent hydrolase K9V48_14005 n=1 Tax=Metabacillus rhizolycopersici TaxID=2875709 RepID=A0ABS7UTS3_9BACI|nr:putative metal-dependent hydrolase [Metabacillus rhizolycopersici]MBZ5751329.1 putative metal-dependent hydrolase [Metabacillus rhizolycopersici]